MIAPASIGMTIHTIRTVETEQISIEGEVEEIGSVEVVMIAVIVEEIVVAMIVAVMIVVEGTSETMMAVKGMSGQAVGEAMIGTTLEIAEAMMVAVTIDLCPRDCASWPERTLASSSNSSSSSVVEKATMGNSNLVVEETLGAVVII